MLVAAAFAPFVVALFVRRIPQDLAYHQFVDARTLLGVPNFLNVFSNVFFLIVGVWGVLTLLPRKDSSSAAPVFVRTEERWPWLFFFIAVALTAFGSAYYHEQPGNHRLVWDRLPITLGFMSFVAAMISERVSVKDGLRLLLPLWLVGAGSVFYWQATESRGVGDLRLYGVVQFGSLLFILVLVFLFPPRYSRSHDLLVALLLYALAKLFEYLDKPIYSAGQIVSGHTLKHLAAALSAFWVLRMLKLRAPISANASR